MYFFQKKKKTYIVICKVELVLLKKKVVKWGNLIIISLLIVFVHSHLCLHKSWKLFLKFQVLKQKIYVLFTGLGLSLIFVLLWLLNFQIYVS
jgi:hypothetical protein